MTPKEVFSEIQKMPLNEVREIVEQLTDYLHKQEQTALTAEQNEAREDEFERYLLKKGLINQLPTRDETDAEFDEFELLTVKDEPLSETIIRER